MMKIIDPVRRLFAEAHRRLSIRRILNPSCKDWVGLGTEAMYRPAIESELMVFVGPIPPPRVSGWFLFTEKGLSLYRKMRSEGEFPA